MNISLQFTFVFQKNQFYIIWFQLVTNYNNFNRYSTSTLQLNTFHVSSN